MNWRKSWIGWLAGLWMLFVAIPVFASGQLIIPVNHSEVVNVENLERVAVANPEVADVVVVSPSEMLVVGKSPGVTTMQIWSSVGRSHYEVEVTASDPATANDIRSLLGYGDIKVNKVNKTVVLEGAVQDQYEKARAEKIAGAYGDKVVNLLEVTVPRQVKIEAKIVEISKDKSQNLGIRWGNTLSNSTGSFSLGQSQSNTVRGDRVFGWFGSYADINAQLDALVQNGDAKILSQPSIVTLSGEKANILIGGQIPVPTTNGDTDNQITVEWKEYGIKLDIAPEVSGLGLIASKVKAEVSTLDYSSSTAVTIGTNLKIPAMKTRRAETAVTLSSGETMAIGGLISSEDSKSVSKLPLLGDIPVLGNLFTSRSFKNGKTEVLIFMTPTLFTAENYTPVMSPAMKSLVEGEPSVQQNKNLQPKTKTEETPQF